MENCLVNHPPHYKRNGMEAIDVIEAFELDYHKGNAVKYLLRSGHKENEIQDLEKAAWYVNRLIDRKKKELELDIRQLAEEVAEAKRQLSSTRSSACAEQRKSWCLCRVSASAGGDGQSYSDPTPEWMNDATGTIFPS